MNWVQLIVVESTLCHRMVSIPVLHYLSVALSLSNFSHPIIGMNLLGGSQVKSEIIRFLCNLWLFSFIGRLSGFIESGIDIMMSGVVP